jgi:two-component system CitB family sensor kinase
MIVSCGGGDAPGADRRPEVAAVSGTTVTNGVIADTVAYISCMTGRPRLRPRSLAQQLLALQVLVITLLVATGAVAEYLDTRRDVERTATQRVLAVVDSLAQAPEAAAAFTDFDLGRCSALLQPLAERARVATGTDFVVFMTTRRVRCSHPNPERIGGEFLGHIDQALAGRPLVETYPGTLGPSVRAVAPIVGADGTVRALVSAGITLESVGRELRRELPVLVGVVLCALLAATGGTYLVSRRFRRQTHGLSPAELTRMYEYHDAVLHAVREGLLLVSRHQRLQLANDEAVRLLGLPRDAVGRPVTELPLAETLAEVLVADADRVDEIHLNAGRVLVVNRTTARWEGRDLGSVVTLRDHTDLQALTGELDTVRGFADALSAQAHEASNRLHTVVTMIELGHPEQAVEFATAELAAAQRLTDHVVGAVAEPALAALLLGKAAQAHERGVEFVVTRDSAVRGGLVEPRDVVTVVGNLVDNAIDAALAAGPPRRVTVSARDDGETLLVRVADTGTGLQGDDAREAFRRGWSTKPVDRLHGRGLGLALVGQIIDRHGGSVDVAHDGGAVFTVRLPRMVGAR